MTREQKLELSRFIIWLAIGAVGIYFDSIPTTIIAGSMLIANRINL